MAETQYFIGADRWAGISKLVEECCEVGQVVGKIIGNEGRDDHWDGSHLPKRLVEKMADVAAAIDFVLAHNSLAGTAFALRRAAKRKLFEQWHRDTLAARSTPDALARTEGGVDGD